MKKGIVEILRESLERYAKTRDSLEVVTFKTLVENLEESELEELFNSYHNFYILKRHPELIPERVIKSLSIEDLANISPSRLRSICDPDWWRRLVNSEEGSYLVQHCPHIDIIKEYIESGKPISENLHTRRDLPIEIRAKAFARTTRTVSGSLFSTIVESFPYRNWTRDEVAQYSISLYRNVVHRSNCYVKYLSNWPEDYIREYWNTNIYFKRFALLSRHCPADLIKRVLMYSNMFKEVKAIALTNPNCPPSLKLRYSNDPILSAYTNIDKTKEVFEDFFVY